ncbi:uL15 family ribosomal protein [Patescibacteria group bacterium]
MMQLNKLPKTTRSQKKRLGRGYGSGKGGHTVGRGAKGAKARGKIPLTFAGTKFKKSFIKRLPLQRGKGKFKVLNSAPIIVDLKYLDLLPNKTKVDIDCLVKHGIIEAKSSRRNKVKVLGKGKLRVSLKVFLPCSKGAKMSIEKAGGQVVAEPAKNQPKGAVLKKGKSEPSKEKKKASRKKSKKS